MLNAVFSKGEIKIFTNALQLLQLYRIFELVTFKRKNIHNLLKQTRAFNYNVLFHKILMIQIWTVYTNGSYVNAFHGPISKFLYSI